MASVRLFIDWLQGAILVYFFSINTFYLLFTLISLRELYYYIRSLYFGRRGQHVFRPISILVPARDEERTIIDNISSLLALAYPEYEVIAISDGSSDNTVQILVDEFTMVPFAKVCRRVIKTKEVKAIYRSLTHPRFYLVDKEHGGKADALNAGINYSSYPIFCSIDADSVLEEDALMRASRVFAEDSRVVAVGGIVRVINGSKVDAGRVGEMKPPRRLIELFQVVEYIRGFLTGRTAWSRFGSLMIISGAFSLFRKKAVLEVGGYRTDSVAEDMDLVVRLHRHHRESGEPYKITFVPDPICWTQVPATWQGLLLQRNRWQRGLVESLWRNRRMMLNGRYGEVGALGYPYFVVFEAMGPIIELLGYVSVIALYFLGELSTKFAVLFFLVALLYGALLNVGSVMLENFLFRRYERARDFLKLCAVGFFEFFGYRQLVTIERVVATFQRNHREWGKPHRRAFTGGKEKAS